MKITIGGVEYVVKFEKSRAKIAEDEPLGMIRYTEGTIQIYKKLSPCRIRRVLMHEIVHGVVTNYSIGQLRHEDGVHDERAIDQLAIGLCEALESIDIYLPAEDSGSDA